MPKQEVIIDNRTHQGVAVRKLPIVELVDSEGKKVSQLHNGPMLPYGIGGEPRTSIHFYDLYTHYYQVSPAARIGAVPVLNVGLPASITGQADYVNGYVEWDDESIVQFSYAEQQAQLEYVLSQDPFGNSRAVPSNRPVTNALPLWKNIGNLDLNVRLQRLDVSPELSRVFPLSSASKPYVLVRSIAQRQAAWSRLEEYFQTPDSLLHWNASREALDAEASEEWLSIQSALTRDAAAVLTPQMNPGQWDLQFDSPFHYESFRLDDTDNFKYTADASFYAEEAIMPRINTGGKSREVKVYLLPMRYRATFQYFAWYAVVSLFFVIFVPVPHTVVFFNRAPIFPTPLIVGDSNSLSRAWAWIERSAAHGRAVQEDYTFGQSGFFVFQLQFTSAGRFEITRTDSFAKSLAAIVEIGGVRRYVWRRTGTNRDLSVKILAGPLETYHIKSWDVFTISIPGGNWPVFPD